MSRYIKRPRPEAIDEDFIALVLLVGPLAWPSRRREGEVSAESPDSPRRSRWSTRRPTRLARRLCTWYPPCTLASRVGTRWALRLGWIWL